MSGNGGQVLLSPFDPNKPNCFVDSQQQSMTSSSASLQTVQVMKMFDTLEISNSNFRPPGGGSAVKPNLNPI